METAIGQWGYKWELRGYIIQTLRLTLFLNNLRINQKVKNMRISMLGTRIVFKTRSRSDGQIVLSLTWRWVTIAVFSTTAPLWSFNYSVSTALLLFLFTVLLIKASVYRFFFEWFLASASPSLPCHPLLKTKCSVTVSHIQIPQERKRSSCSYSLFSQLDRATMSSYALGSKTGT